MAAHAPAAVETDSRLVAIYRSNQFFPSPPWAYRALADLIARLDPGRWTAWEPACGMGHGVQGLRDHFSSVRRTDIYDYGWDGLDRLQDFLARDAGDVWGELVDWVISNPPFKQAAQFVTLGLARARRGVAMLARMSWFETLGRFPLFFPNGQRARLTVFAPFFERVPMVLGAWDPEASTATAYAWFIWMKDEPEWIEPMRRALGACAATVPIPPGSKAKFTIPDDARLFGRPSVAPLLELM
jgi:hypothetical protein